MRSITGLRIEASSAGSMWKSASPISLRPHLLEFFLRDFDWIKLRVGSDFNQRRDRFFSQSRRACRFGGARIPAMTIAEDFDLASFETLRIQFAVEQNRIIGA